MGRRKNAVPSYLHHKPSGQAYCRVDGRPVYLGTWNSPESRKEYGRIIGRLQVARPRPPKGSVTVAQLVELFKAHAEAFYRDADGNETSRVDAFRFGLRALVNTHGGLPAAEFGPAAFKEARQVWVDAKNSRSTCNFRGAMVKQVFKWAVAEELLDEGVWVRLSAVPNLAKHRTEAREAEKVRKAPEADVMAAVRELSHPAYKAMLLLQLHTGMRPGEVCRLRPGDVDRAVLPWRAAFARHKTEHKDKSRVVYFGPKARHVLGPYLARDETAYCFVPAEISGNGAAGTPHVNPRDYWRRVKAACGRAGVPAFAPNRVRHTKATSVREVYGLEGAQHVLDHASMKTTEIYAERSEEQKRKIAEEAG